MSERPRRTVKRRDYRSFSDVTVPRSVSKRSKQKTRREEESSSADTLYRLRVIDQDEATGMVKVAYVGYSDEHDEWRRVEDVVTMEESEEENDDTLAPFQPIKAPKFCLFEELSRRIKAQLYSNRKGNPVCSIILSFDRYHFDSLSIRASKKEVKGKREVYSLPVLSRLNDLLGPRWFIRGINAAGDFCYIEPGTVSFYLKKTKGIAEYQMKDDGTLVNYGGGETTQLVFQFVRNDGTCRQWSEILQSCI